MCELTKKSSCMKGKLTRVVKISLAKRLKCAFNSQYKNGFQKLLLIAVHVTKNSRNAGNCECRKKNRRESKCHFI